MVQRIVFFAPSEMGGFCIFLELSVGKLPFGRNLQLLVYTL